MGDTGDSSSSNRSAFQMGADLFSYVIGAVATILLAPQIYHLTANAFVKYVGDQLGRDWESFFEFLWRVGVGVGTFAICLMLTSITLRLGFAKLSMLIFRR